MDPANNMTFCQRYWVSLEHYAGDKHGAEPVYLLDGGETSGANVSQFMRNRSDTDGVAQRLPFMEKGEYNRAD